MMSSRSTLKVVIPSNEYKKVLSRQQCRVTSSLSCAISSRVFGIHVDNLSALWISSVSWLTKFKCDIATA